MFPGETKVGCENCDYCEVIHPVEGVEGYQREFLDNMQTVEEDKDTWNKYVLSTTLFFIVIIIIVIKY
jgi:hypothetical protein